MQKRCVAVVPSWASEGIASAHAATAAGRIQETLKLRAVYLEATKSGTITFKESLHTIFSI